MLALPPVTAGRDPITERTLRPIVSEPEWGEQLRRWYRLRASALEENRHEGS